MSEQKAGFYFSSNADGSAHDQTIFAEQRNKDTATIGARYKNSDPSHLYEIEMDASDLYAFGNMCIALAHQMQIAKNRKQVPDPRLYSLDKLSPDDDRLRGLRFKE